MTHPPPVPGGDWWRRGVLYQIYPRSFQDSNGDGVGDLPGITARLDHLNDGTPDSLGIDGIWLSPFYPSPMADFGYDVSDYCDVGPEFGTLGDFDELLGQAHERGIRVIIDLVPNHTSEEHPWFVEARASRSNPKRDWYVWADPAADGSAPNDWRSAFPRVGRAWTIDPRTSQYYLHSFTPQQPDLNWWKPDVRKAFEEILRFWLDRGVDGFRIDVAHRTVKRRELQGHTAIENIPGILDRTPPADEPELHALLRTWRALLDEYDERMAVGEVFLFDPARLVSFYGAGDDELHLAFNFAFLRAPWSAAAFRDVVATFERLLPEGAWPDYTLSNHDNPRAVSRYAPDGDLAGGRRRARLAALMLLTLRGTPFLYYGEEIGMADGPVPADRIVDVAGRDPERTPMQWDGSSNADFSTGDPWLPVPPEARTVNVAAQRSDSDSIFSLYRQLIWHRRARPSLRIGSYRVIDGLPSDCFGYVRDAGTERAVVLLNFGTGTARISAGRLASGGVGDDRSVLSTLGSGVRRVLRGRLELEPDEGLLIESPTGVERG
jgi:alpha-glucosidase